VKRPGPEALAGRAKKAGLPRIRFHDLRHTAATLLLQEGMPVTVVSRMLGHASAKLTLDTYSHVLADSLDEPSHAMEAAIFGLQRVASAGGG
jgi:integrase